MKLQIAVSQASLIASAACTRSHKATTKRKIIISKIRKSCPLKSSYVAPCVKEPYSLFIFLMKICDNHNDTKFSDIYIQANSADPDQTAKLCHPILCIFQIKIEKNVHMIIVYASTYTNSKVKCIIYKYRARSTQRDHRHFYTSMFLDNKGRRG